MIYAAALLIMTTTVITALSFYLCRKVIKPDVTPYDETFKMELELNRFTISYYNSLPKEEIFIESPNGYKIHSIWVPLTGSKKTVILLHGFTYTLYGSVKYVEFFRNIHDRMIELSYQIDKGYQDTKGQRRLEKVKGAEINNHAG